MKISIYPFIRYTFFLITLLSAITLQAQQIESIDQYADYISERYGIPGMAIGVIDKGQVIHKGYYGIYDREADKEVDHNSLFNLHSLSKVFVNVAAFQLIEQGKLSLEDEVTKYIKDYPTHWETVKIKHLLSHSSGIPNIIRYFGDNEASTIENLYAAPPVFKPGSRFDYNQSNYWLLNRIISLLTHEGFDNTIRRQIRGSYTSPLLFDNELAENKLQPKEYRPGKEKSLKMEYSEVQTYMNGAGGINISLDDFIKWNLQLDKNKLISNQTKTKMWVPFDYDQKKHKFTHGWGIYESNGTKSLGFSGGGVAGLRKFNKEDLTIIVMTNGYQYGFDINAFINWIADHVGENLSDIPAILNNELYEIFSNKKEDEALSIFSILQSQNRYVKIDRILNSLGYELLAKGLSKQALTVFVLNTKENPESWNAWDSLAEGYESIGKDTLAIKHYKKSVSLNPNNQHAVERIEVLSKSVKLNDRN